MAITNSHVEKTKRISSTQIAKNPSANGHNQAPRERTKVKKRRIRQNVRAYVFLMPFLLLFGGFVALPAVLGLWMSFTDWSPFQTVQSFVGLANYGALFDPSNILSQDFWQAMRTTGLFVLLSVPCLLVIPLLISLLLDQKVRGATVFRTVFFAPYVLGVAVVGVVWRYLLDTQSGIVNSILAKIGLPSDTPWTVDEPWVWLTLVGVTVWWTAGLNSIIFLAGLKGIPRELYEAAALDGAGVWRTFFAVTLPGLRPVMLFVTTTTVLASANMFGQSYLITAGGPGTSTRTAIMYISDQGLSQNNMSGAAAMSYIMFAFLAIISIINFRLQRERSEGKQI